MTLVTDYLTIDGEVVAETRSGVERDYLPDPLGSTAALLDSSQTRTDIFAYWPYGEERTQGGSTPLRYVGTLGYRSDEPSGRLYVRARHYRPGLARWQTVDPLWPGELPYGYAEGSPIRWVDGSGRSINDIIDGIGNFIGGARRICPALVPIDAFVNFKWGNCCGLRKRCGVDGKGNFTGRSKPIDCLDRACARHDQCMSGPIEFIIHQVPCARSLCDELRVCVYKHGSCFWDPVHKGRGNIHQVNCLYNAFQMMGLYCAIGYGGQIALPPFMNTPVPR